MKLLIKSAVRNVKRNIKSTMMNGIGIAFSAIILLFTFSISQGIESQITSRNIKFETGAVSVNIFKKTANFRNKAQGDSLLNLITNYLDKQKCISDYNFRIYISNSLLYFQNNNQKVSIIGLTQHEASGIKDMLEISDGNTDINKSKGIIISNALSELLDIKIGDNCSIVAQSVDGAANFEDFIIKGIFRYTSQANKFNVYMNYEKAKTLYNTNLPSKIQINLHELNDADNIKTGLLKLFDCDIKDNDEEIECEGMKISSYKDHMSTAKSISEINKYGMLMVTVFLISISFIGIWSMQTENINERHKEIGALLSFGFNRSTVKQIFITEILYISMLFFTIGFAVTLTTISLINLHNGIYLGESASFAFGSAIVNPMLTIKDTLTVFAFVMLYPLSATIISLTAINKRKIIELLNVK